MRRYNRKGAWQLLSNGVRYYGRHLWRSLTIVNCLLLGHPLDERDICRRCHFYCKG